MDDAAEEKASQSLVLVKQMVQQRMALTEIVLCSEEVGWEGGLK